jgi:hypothetical protein
MVAAGAGAKTFAEAWGLMTKARDAYRARQDAKAAEAFSQQMERARLALSQRTEARMSRKGGPQPPSDAEVRQAKGIILRHLKLHTEEGVTADDFADLSGGIDSWKQVLATGKPTRWEAMTDEAKRTALSIYSDAMATLLEKGIDPEYMVPGWSQRPSGHRAIDTYYKRTGKAWQ